MRLVHSPRGGWGYYRAPLIVVSEERTREALGDEYREADDFRYTCHEMAHFWWSIAQGGTRDDWINEGLAEFSAFRFSAEHLGDDFAERRLEQYRERVGRNETSDSIAESDLGSPDREVNWYDKPTLMFLEAQTRFGVAPLDAFLRAFHGRFAETRQATTALFLEEVEKHLGEEARAFFRERLYSRPAVESTTPQTPPD